MKKLVLLLAICVLLPGCSPKTKAGTNTKRYDAGSFENSYDSDGIVCENEAFELHWDSYKKRVSFHDKSTGAVWGPTPAEAMKVILDEDGIPVKNHPQVDSALIVYYYDPKTLSEGMALSYVESVSNDGVYVEEIENGIKVTYDFPGFEISVPVEYTIEKDCFRVTVNPEEISDNGVNYVTGIALSPFMCSIQNGSPDGYLFMPDGSGMIIKPEEKDIVGTEGMKKVYGDDLTIQTYDFYSTVTNINLPVFGVKKGDKALLSVIDKGAEMAYIGWKTGSKNMRYSTLYPFFRIRGYSLIEPPSGFAGANMEVKVFDENIVTKPLSVSYYPLSGDEADYAGMAKAYRRYLINEKNLAERGSDEGKSAIKYVGGLIQKQFFFGVPYKSLAKLTTIEDARKMTEYFNSRSEGNFLVDLIGFGTTGLDFGEVAGGFTASSALGGKKGVKALSEYCKSLKIPMFMDFDIIAFDKSGNGFSGKTAAVLPNGQPARFSSFHTAIRKKNGDRSWLLARAELESAAEKLAGRLPDMGLSGVSLISLSKIIYSDYADPATAVSGGMSSDVENIFNSLKNKGFSVLAGAANDYAAVNADYITDAPIYSSNYDFTYADVPFYQMVFKGYIPMSSTSVNLSADENQALLRCVESGIAPSFLVYYRYNNQLITTKYSFVYGGEFEKNRERIVNILNSLKDYYDSINRAKIVSHEMIGSDVRVTVFDNGVYTAVNYGEKDAETAYGIVPPGGFITGVKGQ